jgi:hypothetical protein
MIISDVDFTEEGAHLVCDLGIAEDHIGLDDNKYIGDIVAEFKNSREKNKGELLQCKLLFKKRLFRESDEAITEPMFVQLSYVQVRCAFLSVYLYVDWKMGFQDTGVIKCLPPFPCTAFGSDLLQNIDLLIINNCIDKLL